MTELSKKLERLIRNSSVILPQRVAEGILVGDVLITNDDTVKNLYQGNELVYANIHLNVAAVKMANMLAKRSNSVEISQIYRLDQVYGKWFLDSQMLRHQYQRAVNINDYNRADILWARYTESRTRTAQAKHAVERMCVL